MGIAGADEICGDGYALVERFAAEAVGVDDVAEFVLWVSFGGGRNAFI